MKEEPSGNSAVQAVLSQHGFLWASASKELCAGRSGLTPSKESQLCAALGSFICQATPTHPSDPEGQGLTLAKPLILSWGRDGGKGSRNPTLSLLIQQYPIGPLRHWALGRVTLLLPGLAT